MLAIPAACTQKPRIRLNSESSTGTAFYLVRHRSSIRARIVINGLPVGVPSDLAGRAGLALNSSRPIPCADLVRRTGRLSPVPRSVVADLECAVLVGDVVPHVYERI